MEYELITAEAYKRINSERSKSAGITAADRAELKAIYGGESDPNIADIMSVIDGVARIRVSGALTPTPDFWAMVTTGNTTYPQIRAAIDSCERDPEIRKVIFAYDTPGGSVAGMIPTMDAIKGMQTPNEALVVGLAASAGYALASQSSKIIASDRSVIVGSIGIRADIYLDPNEVTITSSNAPNKAPDVSNEEGKEVFRTSHLDPLEQLFIEAVASGRKVSEETVKRDFGQGGTFLASAAKQAGMIDEISEQQYNKNNIPASNGEEEASLNYEEFKAKHPDLHLQAFNEGKTAGVTQESDRVGAHIVMAKANGASDIAFDAIEKGLGMTETLRAQYFTAGMNKQSLDNTAADNTTVETPAAIDASTRKTEAQEKAMAVAAKSLKIKVGG